MKNLVLTLALVIGSFRGFAQKAFIDQTTVDKSIKPGDDFFTYANGTWLKANQIPATETAWGTWPITKKHTRQQLQQVVLETIAQKSIPGSNTQKLKDFYNSGFDTVVINQRGIQPILADLKRIDAIQDKAGIIQETIAQYASGVINPNYQLGITNSAPLFVMGGLADPISNDKVIIVLTQGGMGLPEKSYYFDKDEKSVTIRNQYANYLQQLLQLSGLPTTQAASKAQAVLDLETNLAKGARTVTENRNIMRLLNYFTLEKLNTRYSALAWNSFFQQLIGNHTGSYAEKIIVAQPEFFDTLCTQITTTPLPVWKDYLRVKLLTNAAPFLSKPFVKAHFDFYSKALTGQTQMKPRSEQLINFIDGPALGELLGKLYIDKYFTDDAKKRIDDLVQNIMVTFGERITSNSWMTDSTKAKALQKLSTIRRKIAYPDQWRDYTALTIGKQYYENIKAALAFDFRYRMSLIGKPVNRTQWNMSPPTLNAYYNPLNNEIVFPAGILVFPYFDKDADDAVNYGGIATVIGHEISHGFDDQGSQFNAMGIFSNWWTKTDKENFQRKGDALVSQYDQYIALDTMHVNGRLTLGENIGDLCGVTVAYQAFKKTPQGQRTQLIDGLTPDQRFFLSYARIWREKQRAERLRTQLLTDAHSPEQFRVNGPLSNLNAFYQAFNVTEGDKMWRPVSERIVIW